MEMSSIGSFIISKAVKPLFKWSTPPQESRGQLLDPFSVIVQLATNSYKPIGTKLSINDHKMMLQDATVLQGTIRALYGDTKMNVKQLHYPIIHACRHFCIRMSDDVGMQFLFQRAQKGLENLWHTYREDREIRSCISTYVNIIQGSVTNASKSSEMLDMLLRLDVSDVMTETKPAKEIVDVRRHMFDELNKTWDHNKITLVVCLLQELDTSPPTVAPCLFTAIESFMDGIHLRTKQIADGFLEQNDKPW
jgi:hypothetical protein